MIDRKRFPVDPWRLVETRCDEEAAGETETIFAIGNGFLGFRGNHPEGRHAHEHGTFINGFHETWPIKHAEAAYGFAKVGQTIVNVPDPKVLRVYVDDEPLSLDLADIREYERVLDLRDGILTRRVLWVTPSGKEVLMESDALVTFEERHLAVLRMRVTVLNADAPVVVSSQVINRQDGNDVYSGRSANGPEIFDPRKAEGLTEDRVLIPDEHWRDGTRTALSYRTASSGMTLAVVADHIVRASSDVEVRGRAEADAAKSVFRIAAKAGETITVEKYVSYHTSRSVPPSELIDRARRTVDRAMHAGIDQIAADQRAWCEAFWERSDVQIPGNDDLQQAVRWCILQVAMASARADGWGVPAKGVTGSGYSGHYFWDTEIYVMPFLAFTTPLWARNAMRLRTRMLPAARRRAAEVSEAGALFPWRTINGEEASAYYAAGTAQYHINADIAFAIMRYVRATGDVDFLNREGAEVLVETARMWATLGFWRQTSDGEQFHIHGVTGPDEYTTVVNDNLFTNVMARDNLRSAAEVVREMAGTSPAAYAALVERVGLDAGEPEAWERAADAMYIPFNEALGIHPQDSFFLEREVWDLERTPDEQRPLMLHYHPLVIYRFQVLKQADVVLALFLMGDEFTLDEKRADFDYYDPLTTGDSTLSAVVQSILAAEVGYSDLAVEYFNHALFVDLADLHHNAADGVHVASAGGVWTMLVFGFGGMRDYNGELSFDPRLPEAWPELSFRMEWHGARLQVTVRQDTFTMTVLSGDPVAFTVRGEAYEVPAGEEKTIPLDGQGAHIEGRPTMRRFASMRREDGTRLVPTLPPVTGASPIVADS